YTCVFSNKAINVFLGIQNCTRNTLILLAIVVTNYTQ
ncbi:putative integrase core domain protein, partial [Trichinella spiralis]